MSGFQTLNKQIQYPLSGSFTGSFLGIASTASYYNGSVISSSYSLTSSYSNNTLTASYALSASHYSGSVVSASFANTASYYNHIPRITSITSSTNPTPNIDTTDIYSITALNTSTTFGAPTGTPVNGQKLIIRIKDSGSAQTISYNAAYIDGGAGLQSTTVANKTLHLGFIYNTDNSLNKWMSVAYSIQP